MTLVKPAEPAPYQLAPNRLLAIPERIALELGAGTGRVIEASGKGKAQLKSTEVSGPRIFGPDDDYTGLALLTGHDYGYRATDCRMNGLHVAFRACGGYRQNVCLQGCTIDSRLIGNTQLWVFGFMGGTAGELIIGDSLFTRGGSRLIPKDGNGGRNQSHRIYIGTSTSLAIDGCDFTDNIAGRDIQVYGEWPDPDTGKVAKPRYWHIRNATFAKHVLDGFVSIQTNPYVLCELENVDVTNDYEAIWAYGDLTIRDSVLRGKGIAVRAMRSDITVRLENVQTPGIATLVERGGHAGVKVVRV